MFRTHRLAIFLALIVGIIYVFPHLYFAWSLGPEYKGIYMSRSYDEDAYNVITRQVYDGVSVRDNPYIADYKDTSIGSSYNIPQLILGNIAKPLGIEMTTLALISKFVFPPLIFLAIYFFVLAIGSSFTAARLAAFGVLLGHELAPLNMGSAIKTFLFNAPLHNFLFYNRPINPQVTAIFFFLTLLTLVLLWNNPASRKKALLAGATLGILSYFYFYFWNFSFILLGLIFVAALFMRSKQLIQNSLLAIVTSLVVSIPFLYNTFSALGGGGASINKNYVLTHRFISEKVILLPLLIFLIIFLWNYLTAKYPNKWHKVRNIFSFLRDRKYTFVFLLVLAGFVATNQQVIHGYEIQQHHYHFMTNIPVFIIVMSILFVAFLERYLPRAQKFIIAAAMLLIALHGVSLQASSYAFSKPEFIYLQSYAGVFEWLNNNSQVNDTVFANDQLSEIIPVHTHNTVYHSLHASVYPVPLPRLEHNFFTYMYLEGVTPQKAKEYLYRNEVREKIGQHIFEGQYYRALCGSFGCFPDSVLDDLAKKYQDYSKNTFEQNLKKYQINYILWDMDANPEWKLDRFTFIKEVIREGNIRLLKVL